MKLVKISLALLVLACCMPAMAYKTAVFQNGVANTDAYTDASYKADFVGLQAIHANQCVSNYNWIAAVGWEQDGSGAFGQDQGLSTVLSKWDIKTLRGHVKYIHSGSATWYTVPRNSNPAKRFGLKGAAGYKDLFVAALPQGVSNLSAWGDPHPTTAILDAVAGTAGPTYRDFGTSTTRNTGAGWALGDVKWGPSSTIAFSTKLLAAADFVAGNAKGLPDLNTVTSYALTLAIPQQTLADWLYPERPGAVANTGYTFKWYAASPYNAAPFSQTANEYEAFFFADDETDEATPASLGGATSGYNTGDIRTSLVGTAVALKSCRPKLTVLYEEGTNVPVELSSFDVE